jgi:hypothetical protein
VITDARQPPSALFVAGVQNGRRSAPFKIYRACNLEKIAHVILRWELREFKRLSLTWLWNGRFLLS